MAANEEGKHDPGGMDGIDADPIPEPAGDAPGGMTGIPDAGAEPGEGGESHEPGGMDAIDDDEIPEPEAGDAPGGMTAIPADRHPDQ